MESCMTSIFEYGYYGYNVFEVPSQTTNVQLLSKVDADSAVSTTFNQGSQSVLVDVDINTGEYYKMQTNGEDYCSLLNFVRTNQIGRIPKISASAKIMLYYSVTTLDGGSVDSGIRISEVPMCDGIRILPIQDGIIAPYRIAKYLAATFTIDRFNIPESSIRSAHLRHKLMPQYQGMPVEQTNEKFIFQIHGIRVLGSENCREKALPKSMDGGHYSLGSTTIADIEKDSIELFSSDWYDLGFNPIKIPAYVRSINVPIEIITPMIVTTDPREIDALLASNAEKFYPGDVPGEVNIDMFEPLIRRPHCPGTLPHDYFKYWDIKRPPIAPDHHGNGSVITPIHPGPDWPHHGKPIKINVGHIDENTPPGVYTNGGIMKYSWKDLEEKGAIIRTHRGDTTLFKTPDVRVKDAKITPSDIGPILVVPAPSATSTITIAESAFFGYDALETVYLPKETARIEPHAFYGCHNLETVYIDAKGLTGLHKICDNAFMNCMNLRYVSTSVALQEIGSRAFYHCPLLELTVPPSVATIGENAFHEIFRVICSPKADLSNSGVDPKDVVFFPEDHPYYNPDDYAEEGEESGNDESGSNSEDSSSGTIEPEPDNNQGASDESMSGEQNAPGTGHSDGTDEPGKRPDGSDENELGTGEESGTEDGASSSEEPEENQEETAPVESSSNDDQTTGAEV